MIIRKHQHTQLLHTFRLDQYAHYHVEVTSLSELKQAIEFAHTKKLPFKVIGEGSNLLFLADYQGVLITLSISEILVCSQSENDVLVEVGAGENWHAFVTYCIRNGYYGLENLALIPGKVGACPIQNIGAYGVEVGDLIAQVTFYDAQTDKISTISQADCAFGYRDSVFKQQLKHVVIIAVTFKLDLTGEHVKCDYHALAQYLSEKRLPKTADTVYAAVVAVRQTKLPDPNQIGNAGSFFKNPIVTYDVAEKLSVQYPDMPVYAYGDFKKLSAGWLIERAGLKGKVFGLVQVYPLHSLVLTNLGGANGGDVEVAMTQILSTVFSKFGVLLEVEPELIQ